MSDKDKKDRGGGKDQGPDDKRPRPPMERTGHVKPADPALAEWLERLWTRGNPPDRLELWWMGGPHKDVRRGLVFYENFRGDQPLNLEQCSRLAGELVSAAQAWTDGKRRPCWFELSILDFHQPAAPLRRALGPLLHEQRYAGVYPDGEPLGGGGEVEAEDEEGLKPIVHKYLSKMARSVERTLAQALAATGDVIQLQQGIIVSQQSHVERLQNADIRLREQNQDLADRSLDRETIRKREDMKLRAIGSGVKVAETMIYGWFGMPGDSAAGGQGGAGAAGAGALPQKRPGSREQRLAESFLAECKDENLSVQLFGDWADVENLTIPDVFSGTGLVRPGIFTNTQFGILLSVAGSLSDADALDALLPGGKHAITQEQLVQALPLLTQSMMTALNLIKQLREQARSAAPPLDAGPAGAEAP